MTSKRADAPYDADLLREAQRGSREAFTALYHRYLPQVYGRVRCRIPPPDVEDVTQEVFIAVCRSLGSFRGEAQFSTWLRTLTDRSIAAYYRRRQRQPVVIDEAPGGERERADPAGASAPPGGHTDETIVLQAALQALPEHYQDIILLRFAEGLPFNDIAELRGISLEATKSLFRRAMAALKQELGATADA